MKNFKPEDPSNEYVMSGSHRVTVTEEDVKFFQQGSTQVVSFRLGSLRTHVLNEESFQIHTGRSSPSGAGVIYMQCEDREAASSLNSAVRHNINLSPLGIL